MVPARLSKADGDGEDDLYPDLDPLDDEDFVVILERLADQLREAVKHQEAFSLSVFLDALDVDWARLPQVAIDRLILGATALLVGSAEKVIPKTSPIFAAAARLIIPDTKIALIQSTGIEIGSSLSTADKATGRALLRQQALYIRDEFGRRADAAAAQARRIVASGIERGLGREDMTAELAKDITLRQLGRSEAYWGVVATAFSNRARTATQLNAYTEAEIVTYRFVAVLDERTTDICRYMDGKVFRVSSALAQQRQSEALTSADDIKNLMPWVYKRRVNGRSQLYYERNGEKHHVAWVDESAVGSQNVKGIFSGGLSDAELEAAGVMVPPLHPDCRSTIVTEG